MLDHDHPSHELKHSYALEYEYGREVKNRTSVWRFCRTEDRDTFVSRDPGSREKVKGTHRSVKAAGQRVRSGRYEWEQVGRIYCLDYLGRSVTSGVHRVRL